MKVIVNCGIAKYVFEDSDVLDVQADKIVAPDQVILDLNASNATVYTNVTDVPQDYAGCKYFYDGSTWTLIPVPEEPPE